MMRVLLPDIISPQTPSANSVVHDFHGRTMGTSWSVRAVVDEPQVAQELQAEIQRRLDAVVMEMSHWEPHSNLGRFNAAPAGSWHTLPEAFFTVLSYAMSVAAESGGAYDPAAGALVNAWGFGPHRGYQEPSFVTPSSELINAYLAKRSWREIKLDPVGRRAYQPGGALLDLSSVAKGFGVDQVALYLERRGIEHYLVEVGGELRGAGMKPDAQPWWVMLEQPPHFEMADGKNAENLSSKCSEQAEFRLRSGPVQTSTASTADRNSACAVTLRAGSVETLFALHGLSVATSGDYRRYFHFNNRFYPHTLDPRTGYPVTDGIASVTVAHESCMAADALSTALMVLGVEQGLRFAEERRLAARFLKRSGQGFIEHVSSRFLEMLQ